MLLKIGIGKNTYRLLPNISSFEYTNKIYPKKNPMESMDDYLSRVLDLYEVHLETRVEHDFDVFDIPPHFNTPENQKVVREFYSLDGEYSVRKLKFVVDNRYTMEIFTPYVCYCCNDEGKTIETLR